MSKCGKTGAVCGSSGKAHVRARGRRQGPGYCLGQYLTRRGSLPTSSCEAAFFWQGSHIPGPTTLGKLTTCLRLWRSPTDLNHGRHSLHTPAVPAVLLSLPSPTEQESPNKKLPVPPLVWVEKRHLQSEVDPKPKWNMWGCISKEKGNLPL